MVLSIARSNFSAVFGTRAVKCTDLSGRLKSIYGKARGLYLVSKYGGMLLSTATLFLIWNRYVTDTLTSVKGFDSRLLRSLDLQSDGMKPGYGNRCQAVHGVDITFSSIPVEYKARTKMEGKKSTPMDGLESPVRADSFPLRCSRMKLVSIVIPAYNEAAFIGDLLRAIAQVDTCASRDSRKKCWW